MDQMTLTGRVLFPDGVLRAGEVTLEGDSIAAVHTRDTTDKEIIAPGFIDLQVNGSFGHDLTANPETMFHVASALLQTGVTAYLPTIITSPLDTYRKAFDALSPLSLFAKQGRQARILGLHLEGPYLSPKRVGAHDPKYLRARVDPIGDGLISPHVRLMTLAPELENGLQAIRDLRARGVVVSIGHTAASYEQVCAAFDAGATWGTHLFNAMNPLHHREPGVIGALLADERVMIGVIPDGVHVHPSIFKWLIKAVGVERLTLVTDAIAAAGSGAGVYVLGDRCLIVDDASARLENGTLAGSILTMDQAVRNLVAWGACSLANALTMASTTPSRLLGLTHLGRVAAGCPADLVVLDEDLQVQYTIVNGELGYMRGRS
jgi:N-acetylglucosamine-6-phosphate deacetylase